MILPLFKSHFSIGKSILTLNRPKVDYSSPGPDSIFDIAEENNLDKIVLVEDSFMGFLEARKVCMEMGIQLIFGLRMDVSDEVIVDADDKKPSCLHKIIIFPKNSKGCKLLNEIYTEAKTKNNGYITMGILDKLWDEDLLNLSVPFYDSFIFRNLMSFDSCFVDFKFTKPEFFIEDNGLPFDELIKQSVLDYCAKFNFETLKVQSIYYKKRLDFSAFMTYKLICGRNSFGSRQLSLEKPNIDHFGSDQFCWESYMEKNI